MQEGRIPKEWMMGLIVSIWKRKGDVHDTGKYRGTILFSHVLKLLEMVLDAKIRRRVENVTSGRTARVQEEEISNMLILIGRLTRTYQFSF